MDKTTQAKVEKPHARFDDPHQVVADPELTKEQKAAALAALEQDARQLATASDEGMSGGEPTQLHDVLQAERALEKPPMRRAYDLVLKDLRARLEKEQPGDARTVLELALTAIDALSMANPDHQPADAAGALREAAEKLAAAADRAEEIEREKQESRKPGSAPGGPA